MFRRTLLAALLVLLSAAANAAATATASSTPAAAGNTLYQALGGRANILALTSDFVGRLKADSVIGSFFKNINHRYLANQLADQICQASGGPCVLDSPGMKAVHEDLHITQADFSRLVYVLQQTMREHQVPQTTQDQLIGLLAPMQPDIVSK